jgi:hypothetical protein
MSDQNTALALLLAQAERQGADMLTLRALIEEACGAGAERALTELELVEVSLVTFPMQPKARVHALEENARIDS